MIEDKTPAFDWKYALPGVPSVRMYGYSVEVAIVAGLGLYFLSGSRETRTRLVLFFGTTILWMLLFWSGGRGGFFAILVATTLAALITPRFIIKVWKFLGSTVIIGAGLSLLLPVPSGDFGLLGRIDKTANSGSVDQISSGRVTLWSDAYSLFLERPVFGHGITQYRHITTQIELVSHPGVHNILLESLISFGLVGTLLLILLIGKIWGSAAIRLRGNHSLSTIPMFLIATSLLVHGLVSGTYYHIHSVFMIAISLGFLLNNQE